MRSLQKISFSVLLSSVLGVSSLLFIPTEAFSALSKKKLEIIIDGENFCKDDKDCAGDSFCHMTSHICISCSAPFEWVGGTQCVCPSGTVPNADNTDCVECMSDENCHTLKGNLHWVCDTDANTCECLSGLHEESGQCVCDNPNKTPDEDGNCICQISQTNCPNSDFTGENDCNCCPTETPKWNGLECRTCADVDATKPYYNSATKTCVECLTDTHCENEQVCSSDKKCVCEMTQGDCLKTDFMGTDICACCPADLPVWDNSAKKCKACATLQPVYNTERHVCTCDESLGYAPDLEDGKCVCKDKIILPQQAIFARPTGCYEKELISGPIGPYVCAYDIYVKGHIDDDFLIVDNKGNVLLPSYGNQHHMVDGILYRLQPGTQIYIYAQDNFCDIIAWERDLHGSEARTPIPGTLELRLVK